MKKDFVEGAKAATPIILGYIPVGIAYGMMAKATGLTFFKALSFSLFVYTGAGQMAAVTMLAQNTAYITIVFTMFILNLRHIIMSICIMEKMEKTSLPIRLLLSFGITDEVFAMGMTDKKINKLTPAFFAGLSLFSYLSWNVFYFQGGSTMKFGVLIFFLCLSTYLPRMLPALFMNKIQVSGKLATFLQLIPYTAMASLIFPAILYVDDNMCIGIIAGIVASVTALKKVPVIGVVLSSVVACLLVYSFKLS